jgi:hypothetical protein
MPPLHGKAKISRKRKKARDKSRAFSTNLLMQRTNYALVAGSFGSGVTM